MPRIDLKLEPLTADAFAPYGDVIEVREDNKIIPINYGKTERHHDLAGVDVGDEDGAPIISIFRSVPTQLPFRVKIMERHPLGSQAFMPLTGNPYLVVVAPAGEFDPGTLRAFFARADQGVNYHKGTWHHYCLALDEESDFLVIDRIGDDDNCDEIKLDNVIGIVHNCIGLSDGYRCGIQFRTYSELQLDKAPTERVLAILETRFKILGRDSEPQTNQP